MEPGTRTGVSLPANDYHFVTHWRLPGTPEQISDMLGDTALLRQIWPSVYGGARDRRSRAANTVSGSVVRMRTVGHLPYVLRWAYKVVESRYPLGYTIEARGDLAGPRRLDPRTGRRLGNLTYDWRVRAEKPLLQLAVAVAEAVLRAQPRPGHGRRSRGAGRRVTTPTGHRRARPQADALGTK